MAAASFQYRAKDAMGRALAGVIEAATPTEARQKLRKQSLFVLELRDAAAPSLFQRSQKPVFAGRARKSDVLAIISQLTIMNQSGVDLAESLRNAAANCGKPHLKAALEAVHADVTAGVPFSTALARHPKFFDESFTAGIAAGERTGTMPAVFERLTYLLRSEIRLQATVRSMLMYPMVLSVVTFGVLLTMIFFVLPQFATVFEDLGTDPPPLTAFLLAIGSTARANIWFLAAGAATVVGSILALRKHPRVRRAVDWTMLYTPILRDVTRTLTIGRVFRLLGTMLQTNVQLLDGIRLCRNSVRNLHYRALFDAVESDVLQGKGLAHALRGATFLPLGAAQMIGTAERSGKLGQVLQTVGEYYEDEGEVRLRDAIKLLEPAIILILGAVVAGVVLSIVLPLLDVTSITNK
jgi:type IV pilus assembly protein PilC